MNIKKLDGTFDFPYTEDIVLLQSGWWGPLAAERRGVVLHSQLVLNPSLFVGQAGNSAPFSLPSQCAAHRSRASPSSSLSLFSLPVFLPYLYRDPHRSFCIRSSGNKGTFTNRTTKTWKTRVWTRRRWRTSTPKRSTWSTGIQSTSTTTLSRWVRAGLLLNLNFLGLKIKIFRKMALQIRYHMETCCRDVPGVRWSQYLSC